MSPCFFLKRESGDAGSLLLAEAAAPANPSIVPKEAQSLWPSIVGTTAGCQGGVSCQTCWWAFWGSEMDAGDGLAALFQLFWGQATGQIALRNPGELRAQC